MPKYLVKISNPSDESDAVLIEWSTVVDAPVAVFSSIEELVEHTRVRYGQAALSELPARLWRVALRGHSSVVHERVDDLVRGNRAGDNEETLSMGEIWAAIQPYVDSLRGTDG